MEWKSLDKIVDKEKISNKLNEIAEFFVLNIDNINDNGLLTGKAGIALFLIYYSISSDKKEYFHLGLNLLLKIINCIDNIFNNNLLPFCSGLAGLGWLVEHLEINKFLNIDTNDILKELDPLLHKIMKKNLNLNYHDYLHGGIGFGFYFLIRRNKNLNEYHRDIIEYLERAIVKNGLEFKWISLIDFEKGVYGYNLGLSHGISSIIIYLSKILKIKPDEEIVLNLLNGAIIFLLNQENNNNNFKSYYPNYIINGEEFKGSRLAWCYGDLGISVALWHAASVTNNKDWKNKSVEILLHSSKRKHLQENGVIDACFCHGTSGIAHIFNRMYNYTGIEEFKETAIYWIEETLKMSKFEDGFAGYKTFYTDEYGGWKPECGILNGIAGIGLVLMAAISDIEPKWDSCLLLS